MRRRTLACSHAPPSPTPLQDLLRGATTLWLGLAQAERTLQQTHTGAEPVPQQPHQAIEAGAAPPPPSSSALTPLGAAAASLDLPQPDAAVICDSAAVSRRVAATQAAAAAAVSRCHSLHSLVASSLDAHARLSAETQANDAERRRLALLLEEQARRTMEGLGLVMRRELIFALFSLAPATAGLGGRACRSRRWGTRGAGGLWRGRSDEKRAMGARAPASRPFECSSPLRLPS